MFNAEQLKQNMLMQSIVYYYLFWDAVAWPGMEMENQAYKPLIKQPGAPGHYMHAQGEF